MKMICSWRQPKLKTPQKRKIKNLIAKIAEFADFSLPPGTYLSVIFPGPRTMRKINRTFLNHDYLTDVICFNYITAEDDELAEGDVAVEIFISPDIALRRASENHDLSYPSEMVLYLVHAILHAAGYHDKTPAQKKKIRAAENRIIEKLKKEFNFSEIFQPE